jgi:hypothetical protein
MLHLVSIPTPYMLYAMMHSYFSIWPVVMDRGVGQGWSCCEDTTPKQVVEGPRVSTIEC